MPLGIRGKLISIFLIIKIIPLVLLGGVAWKAIQSFGDSAIEQSQTVSTEMRNTVKEAGKMAVNDSVRALDIKAREAIERLTTDTALNVARFLYDRDSEILFAANLRPDDATYREFLDNRTRFLSTHKPWILDPQTDNWIPAPDRKNDSRQAQRLAKINKNAKDFHYRPGNTTNWTERTPLYLAMTFIGLNGQEIIKVTNGDLLNPAKTNVAERKNTFLKAETYFAKLKNLKPGEIYVSDVIGAYVPSKIIGPYTRAAAKKAGIAFDPQNSAYAGKENPVGQRYRAIVRWATPVIRDGRKVGYVSLALNHSHIMEFTDHIVPTEERYSDISDASSGNYAFMWDYKGRNISHPRDYFIIGYDPKTGKPAVPWLAQDLYDDWQNSNKPFSEFQKTAPHFHNPGENHPAATLTKKGNVGLDCRYLNFAPQCAGWWNLTEDGGSGSFVLYWSGLWKLTTAAAIPYYTGQYGQSRRGFGFVTIGANVDEFHRAANETEAALDTLINKQDAKTRAQEKHLLDTLRNSITRTATELTIYTIIMIIIVIFIAIWMASILSSRITRLIDSLRKIQNGDLSIRAQVDSRDEMGELAGSLNNMTQSLQVLLEENRQALQRAEASSQAKTDFLAGMSHELRTPLNAIIGFSDVIKNEIYGPVQPATYAHYADDIYNSGQHLLTLINDVLDVARIGSGELHINETEFDLSQALEESIRMLHPIIEQKSLKIDLKGTPLPAFYGDNRRIKQVFLNILSNAAKFTHNKGKIMIISGINSAGDISFRFKDNGIGMTADEIEIALTPFAQIQSALSREYEGSGLGLPLSRNLVKMHGGNLTIESKSGQGSEVLITLPKDRLRP
jgi:signal transduction histidine kinase